MTPELHKEPIEATIDNEQDEYLRMLLMLQFYRPRPEVRKAIKDAYDAQDWDWKKCDGCTGVSEAHSPKGMKFPPCVQHDYWCALAYRAKTFEEACRIRERGDELFLWGMTDFRMNPIRRWARYLFVRWFWLRFGRKLWSESPRRLKVKLQ